VRRARAAGTLVSIDVNYRRGLWTTAECREVLGALGTEADLVISTADDARRVYGLTGDPGRLRDGLVDETGASHAVITAGGDGAYWASGELRGHTPAHAPATIVDRIGAGDAFAAGTILGLLEGDLESGVAMGLAMAALKLGMTGDHLTSSRAEVERLQRGGHSGDVAR
jgi:2-dehydro-3-deoxygluconokinase